MTPYDLRSQLEEDLSWRHEEIIFFQNIGSSLSAEEWNRYRRSLVLIVYAHFEGFCKVALSAYLNAVNQEMVSCFRAAPAVIAASFHELFKALKNPESKNDFFRNAAPDDRKLHSFSRDLEFIERAREIMRSVMQIPDAAVDMESNLKPVVLKKNLYRLGLDVKILDGHETAIGKLLWLRNNIAHGASKNGISLNDYEEVKTSAFKVMNSVLHIVYDSFVEKAYIRNIA